MNSKKHRKSIFRQDYVDLMKHLKEARLESDMTQSELGEALGQDHTFVSKYENCIRRLDLFETIDICKVLGISKKALWRWLY